MVEREKIARAISEADWGTPRWEDEPDDFQLWYFKRADAALAVITHPSAVLREALTDCVGALQFILAFYEPGQRHLDTEAWKQACAGGVAAYVRGATLLEWTMRPIAAVSGAVHYDRAALAQTEGEEG